MGPLRQFIREVAAGQQVEHPMLTSEVVHFLIMHYAGDEEGHTADLRWKYFDFGKRSHPDGRTIGGMYDPGSGTILINKQPQNVVKKMIDVLHEIQHYRQHMTWEKGNDTEKLAFIDGKRLPKDMTEQEAVDSLSFDELVDFWETEYGYRDSPHEVDARRFAAENGHEALGYIKQHFI